MTRAALQVTPEHRGSVTVLHLSGRLVLEDGDAVFREAVNALIAENRVHLVVDLADVTSIDSAGIGVLVGRFLSVRRRGGDMKLANLTANLILSTVASLLYGQRIRDEATAYKVFRRSVLDRIDLRSRRFEFCPEFTGRVLKARYRILEIPIEYNPRGILEGKKIKARDGFIAVYWLFKVWFQTTFSRRRAGATRAIESPR